jgi:hypothetical protein
MELRDLEYGDLGVGAFEEYNEARNGDREVGACQVD